MRTTSDVLIRYREWLYRMSWHIGHFPSRGLLVYRVSMQVPRAVYPSRATYSYYSRLAYQEDGITMQSILILRLGELHIRERCRGEWCRACSPRGTCEINFFVIAEAAQISVTGDIKFRWIANGGTETTRSRSDLNPDLTGRVIFRSTERRYKPRPWESTRSLDSAFDAAASRAADTISFSSR